MCHIGKYIEIEHNDYSASGFVVKFFGGRLDGGSYDVPSVVVDYGYEFPLYQDAKVTWHNHNPNNPEETCMYPEARHLRLEAS